MRLHEAVKMVSIIAMSCLVQAPSASPNHEQYLGVWEPNGRAGIATLGNMKIEKERIYWQKTGYFKILGTSNVSEAVVIELSDKATTHKSICGKFVRLGPKKADFLPVSYHTKLLDIRTNLNHIYGDMYGYSKGCAWSSFSIKGENRLSVP